MTVALLIMFQTFWSSSYVAMKLAMGSLPIGMILILRYGIAAAILVPMAGFKGWQLRKRDWSLIILTGMLNFSLSPFFQLKALTLTHATDTAVLVAFEPIATALMAVVILKERFTRITLFAFFAATIGVFIMSDIHWQGGMPITTRRLLGNGLFLMSIMCEALYSTISRRTTQRTSPLKVITLMTISGFLCDLAIFGPEISHVQWSSVTATAWGSVIFLAVLCSAVGYGGWTYLSRRIPINQLTLSLFLQPVIGAIVATLVLHERITLRTFIGAGVIFSTLLIWLYSYQRQRKLRVETIPSPL